MEKIQINELDILKSLSRTVDLVAPEVSGHHMQVAHLAYRIAQHIQLPVESQYNIFKAGMIHDIGAISVKERLELLEDEPVTANSHGFLGARMLENFKPFSTIANIIRYHHLPWDYGRGVRFMDNEVPIESHILHLADRVCVQLKNNGYVLDQLPGLIDSIRSRKGTAYVPELAEALISLTEKEHVWLELFYSASMNRAPESFNDLSILRADEVLDISRLFSHIIDFRSRFTATHSAGVAKTAESLAQMAGFSENECRFMLIAGYLHDLGKLAIDNRLLEKPGKLDAQEYNIVRSHTFYTYQMLKEIKGFDTINRWASFHHEKMNGNGYPFHLSAENIPIGSRVMAVADIFTAITEPRPYRKGMHMRQVADVLRSMVKSGAICGKFVTILLDNMKLITSVCLQSQLEAAKYYDEFLKEYSSENQMISG